MKKLTYHEIYEEEYKDDKDVNFLFKELKSGTHLEIGCGTGRILNGLAKRKDLKLYGIDVDKTALTIAKKKFKKKINIIHSPAEKFISKIKFDSIFFMFNGFMYLNDCQKKEFLKNSKKNLKKNGFLYISIFNPCKHRLEEKFPYYKFQKKIKVNKTEIKKFEYNLYNLKKQTVDRAFNYEYISRNNNLKRITYEFKQYYLFKDQFLKILKLNKFHDVSIYGNFKKNNFDELSPIILAKIKNK